MHEEIQVGKRFAEREPHLVPIHSSPKQNLDQIETRPRHMAGGDHFVTASPMVCGESVDPRLKPEKREVVRGQDKGLTRHRIPQLR